MVSPFEQASQMLGSGKLQSGGGGVTKPPDDDDEDPEDGMGSGTGPGVEEHE
jgi:hypothetical protein